MIELFDNQLIDRFSMLEPYSPTHNWEESKYFADKEQPIEKTLIKTTRTVPLVILNSGTDAEFINKPETKNKIDYKSIALYGIIGLSIIGLSYKFIK